METVRDRGVDVWGACEEQAQEAFDAAARHYLHMSGDEFIAAWNAGRFDESDDPRVTRVAMLLPLVG